MSDPGEGMLGRERVRRLLEDVLRRCTADQAEAVLTYARTALTRFADNYIHQNVADATPQLSVRAVFVRSPAIAEKCGTPQPQPISAPINIAIPTERPTKCPIARSANDSAKS